MKEKKHIVLMLSLVVAALIVLFVVTDILRPFSFGLHGHYRWDALGDILSQEVAIPDSKTCAECHTTIDQLHDKDAHNNVPCVDCHGGNPLHAAYHAKPDSTAITPAQAALPKEYNLEGCLYCHRKLKARPTDFPQIDREKHYAFLHVTDPGTKCIACHSPHEPIFLLTEARKARLHPIVYRCTDCHATTPQRDVSTVLDHPTIFQCRDCHASIVRSFEQRSHNAQLECRTCHLFHIENERAGRMYKNGNAKFCLLCHQRAAFKDPSFPPKIDWPAHMGSITYINPVDQKTCLHCHWNNIHEMTLKGSDNPHPANWTSAHRPYIMKQFGGSAARAKCSDCHAPTFCRDCHKVDMPHPASWDETHKDAYKKLGTRTCQTCHKTEFCGGCHDIPQ